jgi:division protein CdvB (Snf7/Vps24/ESCRT-III family)
MVDPDIELVADIGAELGEKAIALAEQTEQAVQTWKSQLPSADPADAQLRAKAEEFRAMKDDRLAILAQACEKIAELISRLDEIASDRQVTVLRTQIATILNGEAATARALASVQELCIAIDQKTG